jgi:hypothetical protein
MKNPINYGNNTHYQDHSILVYSLVNTYNS